MSDNAVAPSRRRSAWTTTSPAPRPPSAPSRTAAPRWSSCSARGRASPHPEHDAVIDALSDAELRGFYRDLVLIRRFDAEATALTARAWVQGQPPRAGGRAGRLRRALRPQDYAFPTYREHGVALVPRRRPGQPARHVPRVNHGGWDPNEKNFHLYTIIIGAQTLHATGYAMGVQRDGNAGTGDDERDTAVIAYFGDGATSQGDVSEALVFSGVNNSPVVFFCQNNQWAISEPNEKQTRAPLWHRARLRLPRHPQSTATTSSRSTP